MSKEQTASFGADINGQDFDARSVKLLLEFRPGFMASKFLIPKNSSRSPSSQRLSKTSFHSFGLDFFAHFSRVIESFQTLFCDLSGSPSPFGIAPFQSLFSLSSFCPIILPLCRTFEADLRIAIGTAFRPIGRVTSCIFSGLGNGLSQS